MKPMFIKIGLGVIALAAAFAAAQDSVPSPAVIGAVDLEDRMLMPPPINGQAYSTSLSSETRSNYLRGGITFNTAYTDNVAAGTSGTALSDIAYSVWPTIGIDKTTSRLHLGFTYAPGFTFYQKTPLNEADHNLSLALEYRLSPHVTVNLRDVFQKASNVFNQPGQGVAGSVSGSTAGATDFVYAPVADRMTNVADVGISYQFSARSMVGASGNFSDLHYPTPSQVLGQLNDSSSRGGSVFYNLRLARRHYAGVTYQYEKLFASPSFGSMETDAHSILFFYTVYPTTKFSASLFAGPQYSQTTQVAQPVSHSTTPAFGGSMNWQAQHTAFAVGYSRLVSSGGGLVGAARTDIANASIRQLLTKNLTASVVGSYANRNVLVLIDGVNPSGHSISGSVSLERQIGTHLSVQAGYTRLHQTYSTVPAISVHPDTNREWIGISYEFMKALGR